MPTVSKPRADEFEPEAPAIESELRRIRTAQRALRDNARHRANAVQADDLPDASNLIRNISSVNGELATAITREKAQPLIKQMLGTRFDAGKAEGLITALTGQNGSLIDGRALPVAAVAMTCGKAKGFYAVPTPEDFFQLCVREKQALEALLADLKRELAETKANGLRRKRKQAA